jgi:hypothetical protein
MSVYWTCTLFLTVVQMTKYNNYFHSVLIVLGISNREIIESILDEVHLFMQILHYFTGGAEYAWTLTSAGGGCPGTNSQEHRETSVLWDSQDCMEVWALDRARHGIIQGRWPLAHQLNASPPSWSDSPAIEPQSTYLLCLLFHFSNTQIHLPHLPFWMTQAQAKGLSG